MIKSYRLAGDQGFEPRTSRFRVWRSTNWTNPQWRLRRVSIPRPLAWQASALPTELRSQCVMKRLIIWKRISRFITQLVTAIQRLPFRGVGLIGKDGYLTKTLQAAWAYIQSQQQLASWRQLSSRHTIGDAQVPIPCELVTDDDLLTLPAAR